MQMEGYTVQTLIRLRLWEQSDLGVHCLLRSIFPDTLNFHCRCPIVWGSEIVCREKVDTDQTLSIGFKVPFHAMPVI